MSEDRHPAMALSRNQRHSYLVLLLLIAEDASDIHTPALADEMLWAETAEDRQQLSDMLSRHYQLQLILLPGQACQLNGNELQKRICFFSHLRRLMRHTPSLAENLCLKITRRLQSRQLSPLAFSDTAATEAIFCPLSADALQVPAATDLNILQTMINYSFGSAGRVRLTFRQRQWLADSPWQPLAGNLSQYCQQQGIAAGLLPDDEKHFLTLLLMLLDSPSDHRLSDRQQQQLRTATSQLISRFSRLSAIDLSEDSNLWQRLYCHLGLAVERHYFSIGIDNSDCNELIEMYPGMFRLTSQALSALEQQYQLTFSRQETMLIALLLVSGAMEAIGYQERQIIILTNENPELEQEIERIVRESLLLPVTIHHQTLASFRQYGAPRGITLVISPYIVQLPLFSPPLIHTELPITDRQQERIRQILTG